jgi:hypothetical protein
MFAIKAVPTRVKHLSSASLLDRLLALPTNIRLGWKGFPQSNTLAYYENPLITSVKSFIRLAPEQSRFLHPGLMTRCQTFRSSE